MRTLAEERELEQLLQQITSTRETLRVFAEEGNQDSRPYKALEERGQADATRAEVLQNKTQYDAEQVFVSMIGPPKFSKLWS